MRDEADLSIEPAIETVRRHAGSAIPISERQRQIAASPANPWLQHAATKASKRLKAQEEREASMTFFSTMTADQKRDWQLKIAEEQAADKIARSAK